MSPCACACGCGGNVQVFQGIQRKWIKGHHFNGKNNRRWRGGIKMKNGYRKTFLPDHLRADSQGYVSEHIAIAEKAMGKPLPNLACIHHVNGNKQDNRNVNLVVCENDSYHSLLHFRQRIVDAGGNPNAQLLCSACLKLKNKSEFALNKKSVFTGCHSECAICRKRRKRRDYWLKMTGHVKGSQHQHLWFAEEGNVAVCDLCGALGAIIETVKEFRGVGKELRDLHEDRDD